VLAPFITTKTTVLVFCNAMVYKGLSGFCQKNVYVFLTESHALMPYLSRCHNKTLCGKGLLAPLVTRLR